MTRKPEPSVLRKMAAPAISIVALIAIWVLAPDRAEGAARMVGLSLREMALVIPPVFVLLGLLLL